MPRPKYLPTTVDGTKVIPKQDKRYQLDLQPGDNSKAIGIIMQFNNLPVIDLKKPEEVRDRINEYYNMCFENDFKPTVSSFAAALGYDRKTLWSMMNRANQGWADLPTLTCDYIKKGYSSLEQLWEYYMQNGKINPVSGIFLAKNNFGYVDKTEYTIEPKATLNESDLEQKYLTTSDFDGSDFD
jgi:hypothetical protein